LDEVIVAPGVYFEYNLVIPLHVHLAGSGDNPSDVSINAQGQGRVLTVEGGLTHVENLSLDEGAADQGGGLLILGGIVGLLLGVEAPQVLPPSESASDGLFVVLAAALVIPIGEELFFRGFALTAWLRDLGPRAALVRSSLLFALVHIANIGGVGFVEGLSQAVLLFVVLLPVAFVLGWLFLRHGMAAAISGHVTYNSLLLLLAYLASKLPAPA